MIFDKFLLMSDAQAVTATAASTDYIDLSVARDLGAGEEMEIFALVTTTTVSAGSTTMTFALQTDSSSGFGTAIDLMITPAIAKATLIAGYEVCKWKVPSTTLRYIRGYYTVSVANFSAGNFTMGLIKDRQALAYYASGLNMAGF